MLTDHNATYIFIDQAFIIAIGLLLGCRRRERKLKHTLARKSQVKTLVDDIGSFPLPAGVNKESFERAYIKARRAIISGKGIKKGDFLYDNFHRVIVDSFRKKCATGLDIVNYPQHYDMYKQITDLIHDSMDRGTFLVDENSAVIPEVSVLKQEAKELHEELGREVQLRVCITGPLELYLRIVGTIPYEDVLIAFAETVKRFARNSILNAKHIKTMVVSLDEPSLGFQEISMDRNALLNVLGKAFAFAGVTKQIHLHSSSRSAEILDVEALDVLSFEYGATPSNIESLSKKMLELSDKQLRVGITRTDIDAIRAELHDRGVVEPRWEQMVDSEETIRKRFAVIKRKFEERLAFVGPDCGLGGWPTQEAAQFLLKRTVDAVRGANDSPNVTT